MARLSHPNVVPVFDVGTHEGRVYLAMELLEGGTLRTWLARRGRGDQRRSRREILRAFLEAEMEKFLFGGGAEKPAGYVPPAP